jgi:hypothetical protein
MASQDQATIATYERPAIRVLGTVHQLTGCAKEFGGSDGHTFGGMSIVCAST